MNECEKYSLKDTIIFENLPLKKDGKANLADQVCEFLYSHLSYKSQSSNIMDLSNSGRVMKMPLFQSYYDELRCTEMFHKLVHEISCFHSSINSAIFAWRHVSVLLSDVVSTKFL